MSSEAVERPASGDRATASTGGMPAPGKDASTKVSLLTERLREAILSGDLEPGSKINLARLREALGVSLSPLREALARLIAVGLVAFHDNRGYRVAPLSRTDLAVLVPELLLCGQLIDRSGMAHLISAFGREGMAEVAIEEWQASSPWYTRRMQRALKFEGDAKNYTGNVGGGLWFVSSHSKNLKASSDLVTWMATSKAYQATAGTYPAYKQAAVAWLAGQQKTGYFAEDVSPVFTPRMSK